MFNNKVYDLIKTDIKSKIKECEKIITYNDDEMDGHDNQSLENKLKKIEEKLNQTQEMKKNIKKEENKKTKDIMKSNLLYEITLDDEYRSFNLYIPKVKLNESSLAKTTFSLSKSYFDDVEVEDSTVIEALDNQLKLNDFKFKKLDKIQSHKPDPMFFSNKYIEFTYTDLSEKDIKKKRTDHFIYNAFKKMIDENAATTIYNGINII